MKISHEEFQKARRISRAIQKHLEDINKDDLRSTDLYPILARKKLIERDKNNGSHFRRFLKNLKEKGGLHLIPQCKFQYSKANPEHLEWHFYRTKTETVQSNFVNEKKELIAPKLTEEEINQLIQKGKKYVANLPRKEESKFSFSQLETRKLYERAYERLSDKEIRLMKRAYDVFGRIDKVAELLKRQPSAVQKKINAL